MSGPLPPAALSPAAQRAVEVTQRLGFTVATIGPGRMGAEGTRVFLRDGGVRLVGEVTPDGRYVTGSTRDAVEVPEHVVEPFLLATSAGVVGSANRAALVRVLVRRAAESGRA